VFYLCEMWSYATHHAASLTRSRGAKLRENRSHLYGVEMLMENE
jgi:hypothetical protein